MDEIIIISPAFTMNMAPHWVAIDKGFFKEEGIRVSTEYILGRKIAELWNLPQHKDKLVFRAPGGTQPFMAAKSGVHLINVVSTQDGPGHDLIARPEIESVAALKSKRIIAGAGPSHLDAVVVLKRFGLDPDKDVVWVSSEEKPPDTERYRVESIIRGEVDAMASGPPHWAMGVKMGLKRLPSARDFLVRPEAGLTTSPEIIKERPDVVLFNSPPNPNAARLFINWFLTKEGQQIYSIAAGKMSRRWDVSTDHLLPAQRMKPGVKYILNDKEFYLKHPQFTEIVNKYYLNR